MAPANIDGLVSESYLFELTI
jgi:hypothetical protein